MSMVQVNIALTHPLTRREWRQIQVTADTGALFSVLPASILSELGIATSRTKTFQLADGREIVRGVGEVYLRLNGEEATVPAIFGEEQDVPLLGVTALEILGLTVDPQAERLVPRKLFLL